MRKQYSAEQIILGIYQAKKKILVHKKGPWFSEFSEQYKIYCLDKKELKAWKRKLNTYCERYFNEKAKENQCTLKPKLAHAGELISTLDA